MIDLLIKNAKTIDGKRIEIAVQSGKIHEVGATLTYDAADVSEELDLGGDSYISAGWIDGMFIVLRRWTYTMTTQIKLG